MLTPPVTEDPSIRCDQTVATSLRVLFLTVLVSIVPVPAAAESPWVWPLVAPHEVVRRFEKPPQNWLPGHRGVDLGSTPDSEVRAAGSGRVVFTGFVAGRPVISIEHGSGLRTTYEPVVAAVVAGSTVQAGQMIGHLLAGHPRCTAAACLHWGLRRGDEYLDPLRLVSPPRVRLKPL